MFGSLKIAGKYLSTGSAKFEVKHYRTMVSGYQVMTMVIFLTPVHTGQWANKRYYKFASEFLEAGIRFLTNSFRVN
jgi:hypothetical protein